MCIRDSIHKSFLKTLLFQIEQCNNILSSQLIVFYFLLFFSGRISAPNMSVYCASKYAAEAFSDSLRVEVKPWGVSVHIIEPTFYNTNIADEKVVKTIFTKYWNDQPQETKDEITESQFKSCK